MKQDPVKRKESEERPEPFATICELINEYGPDEVLDAIATDAKFDAQNKERCPACRKLSRRLQMEVTLLICHMRDYNRSLENEHTKE